MAHTDRPFRMLALERITAAFGEPREIPVERGSLYRWVLERPHGLSIYLTLDSPEMPDLAHILVSDPSSKAIDPISSVVMRSIAEVDSAIERVKRQWNAGAA
jgi:hypothetical protein